MARSLLGWLHSHDVWLNAADVDATLERMARFHDHAASVELPTSLCTISERADMCNPALHADDHGPNRVAVGSAGLQRSLEYLAERAGGAAGAELHVFFHDVAAFEAEVLARTHRPTLLHGDLKPENIGVHDERLVAVDWGELTGVGPAELDVVRFAIGAQGYHTDVAPAEVYDRYGRYASEPLDDSLVRLATLSWMANSGIGMLGQINALKDKDPVLRQRAKDRLRCGIDELRRQFPG